MSLRAILLLAAPSLVAAQPAPQIHRLPATPATVAYGYYSALAKPVLRIASGDIVEVETLITSTPDRLTAAGVAGEQVEASLRAIVTQVTDKGPGGHILTGPIYVAGAEPGDVLEVRILEVRLKIPYGYNGCSGFLRDACAEPRTRIIPIDTVRMTGELAGGITVPLRPFFGSMGVAPPPDSGRVSSNPPGIHAGNLDNQELVAGTTLFIPVHVPGALFEVGDGHAAQGDGEVDQTAIETSLTGRLQLIVRKGRRLAWPRGETPTHVITMGTDTSLTVATRIAVREMIHFLMEARSLPEVEAYRLASIAGDLRITQLVDGKVGVHMMIARSLIGTGAMPSERPPAVPPSFQVEIETSRGSFVLEVQRDWAPRGADRFYELTNLGYFDDSRFFRVRERFIAQFGIPGKPVPASAAEGLGHPDHAGNPSSPRVSLIASDWRLRPMQDDPVKQENRRGTVAYAMTGPGTRTTQLFINLVDNLQLDAQGFAPIGRVIRGMEVVDSLYAGYDESAGGGMRGGQQDSLFRRGNRYLDSNFPRLDRLIRARILVTP